MNPVLVKCFAAEATVNNRRILKFGAADAGVLQANSSVALAFGVSHMAEGSTASAGDRVDTVVSGIALVEFGGTVTRGQRITADANGKAVAATPAEIVQAVIAGGAAGAHTVTGIETTDTLISVLQADIAADSGDNATGNKVQNIVDLTAEFSISAADEIDNTGGTATTSDVLIVTYRKALTQSVGIAMVSAVSGDIADALIVPAAL